MAGGGLTLLYSRALGKITSPYDERLGAFLTTYWTNSSASAVFTLLRGTVMERIIGAPAVTPAESL